MIKYGRQSSTVILAQRPTSQSHSNHLVRGGQATKAEDQSELEVDASLNVNDAVRENS